MRSWKPILLVLMLLISTAAAADDYEDWVARARPEAETFICGPEVWGEDRAVAPSG